MHPSSSSSPLLFLSSSSTSSAPSCAHSVKRQRLRRFSDAPPLTSIPLPEAARAHVLPTSPTSDHQAANVTSVLLCRFVVFLSFFFWGRGGDISFSASLVGCAAGMPAVATSLTWDFTSEVIFPSAIPVGESDSIRSALQRDPLCHFLMML